MNEDETGALMASWSTFTAKAFFGGENAVDEMIENARARQRHDSKHSATGIKKSIHDLCKQAGIACHVLLYENVCNECGFKTLDDPEFGRKTNCVDHGELERKLWNTK